MTGLLLWATLGLVPFVATIEGGANAACPKCDCCGCCEKGTCDCTKCSCECCVDDRCGT